MGYEGHQYYKEILGEIKQLFARETDGSDFWDEFRTDWRMYVEKNNLTMFEMVDNIDGETNKYKIMTVTLRIQTVLLVMN